jgi:hypothetical protein
MCIAWIVAWIGEWIGDYRRWDDGTRTNADEQMDNGTRTNADEMYCSSRLIDENGAYRRRTSISSPGDPAMMAMIGGGDDESHRDVFDESHWGSWRAYTWRAYTIRPYALDIDDCIVGIVGDYENRSYAAIGPMNDQ